MITHVVYAVNGEMAPQLLLPFFQLIYQCKLSARPSSPTSLVDSPLHRCLVHPQSNAFSCMLCNLMLELVGKKGDPLNVGTLPRVPLKLEINVMSST